MSYFSWWIWCEEKSSEEKVKDNPEVSGLNKLLDRVLLMDSRKSLGEKICAEYSFPFAALMNSLQSSELQQYKFIML